jgi:hypothetical protein
MESLMVAKASYGGFGYETLQGMDYDEYDRLIDEVVKGGELVSE